MLDPSKAGVAAMTVVALVGFLSGCQSQTWEPPDLLKYTNDSQAVIACGGHDHAMIYHVASGKVTELEGSFECEDTATNRWVVRSYEGHCTVSQLHPDGSVDTQPLPAPPAYPLAFAFGPGRDEITVLCPDNVGGWLAGKEGRFCASLKVGHGEWVRLDDPPAAIKGELTHHADQAIDYMKKVPPGAGFSAPFGLWDHCDDAHKHAQVTSEFDVAWDGTERNVVRIEAPDGTSYAVLRFAKNWANSCTECSLTVVKVTDAKRPQEPKGHVVFERDFGVIVLQGTVLPVFMTALEIVTFPIWIWNWHYA